MTAKMNYIKYISHQPGVNSGSEYKDHQHEHPLDTDVITISSQPQEVKTCSSAEAALVDGMDHQAHIVSCKIMSYVIIEIFLDTATDEKSAASS